jgi:diguanylate cyclase (GGDEF)-like protein
VTADGSLELPFLDALQVGVLLFDREGKLLFWNRWFANHLENDPGEFVGRALVELFPDLVGSRLDTGIRQAIRSHLSSMLTPGLNRPLLPLYSKPARGKPDRMQQLIQITALRHPRVACLVQVQDMTAAVRRERRLRVQSSQFLDDAYRDALTGVGNRRRFDHALADMFQKAQAAATSLGVLMIDVDFFKVYNDAHGHQKGDECLKLVAQTIQQGLRQVPGDLVFRYGGEEFAVLLPGADENTASGIAERLRARVHALAVTYGTALPGRTLSISIGVAAHIPLSGQRAESIVKYADAALYRAKDDGRNRCRCYHAGSPLFQPVG